jgi:hypothetical protein
MAAASLVVGVVALAGWAWGHFDPASLVGSTQQFLVAGRLGKGLPHGVHIILPPGETRPPPGIHLADGATVANFSGFDLGLTSMFDPVNLPVLRDTVLIEAGAIAAVVIIDVNRRKSRRAKRAAQLARDNGNSPA